MRGSAVLQSVEEEPEAFACFTVAEAEHLEHLLLDLGVVDADASTADLVAVQHEVVRLGPYCQRIISEQMYVLGDRHRERMVHVAQAAFFVLLEQREVDHPQEAESGTGTQAELIGEEQPHGTQGGAGGRPVRGDEQQQVALVRCKLTKAGQLVVQELGDRTAETVAAAAEPGEAASSVLLGVRLQFTDDLAADASCVLRGHRQDFGDRACFDRLAESLEATFPEQGGGILQLQAEADVRFVTAVPVQRIGVGKPGERSCWCFTVRALQDERDELVVEADDVFLVDEADFDVQLGEVRLPVSAQVLVAEAAGDLEVTFEAADHQHLLEQLGALGQGIELAGRQAGGDDEVAGAFRGGAGEQRRLDLDEAAAVQVIPDGLGYLVTQPYRCGGCGAPQVEVAVPEAQLLTHCRGGDAAGQQDWRSAGLRQDGELHSDHLDRSGTASLALLSRPLTHCAADVQHELTADTFGRRKRVRVIRFDHDLNESGPVAQVDEYQSAEVTPAVDPARQADAVAGISRTQFSAPVASFHEFSQSSSQRRRSSSATVCWVPSARFLTSKVPAARSRSPRSAAIRATERAESDHILPAPGGLPSREGVADCDFTAQFTA